MKQKVRIAAAGLVLGCIIFTKSSEAATNLQMVTGSITNGVVEIEIGWPIFFTNNMEVFACTNLLEHDWQVVSSSLSTTGVTSVVWVDTDSTNHTQRFYIVGNADLDTDGEGLVDARENLLFGTDPSMPDSDHDGISDYDEVHANHGYKVEPVPFEWVEISGSGSAIPWTDWDADVYYGASLGFDFPFYGQRYSTANIAIDGYLGFGDIADIYSENQLLPTHSFPSLIAPFWDYLSTYSWGERVINGIYQTLDGSRFIMTWDDFDFYHDPNSHLTFQVELQKSGDIHFRYRTLSNWEENYADGSSATIGIQNSDGSKSILYSYNQAGAVSNGVALHFSVKKTDPLNDDSDGDGIIDGDETSYSFLDPLDPADALEDEDNDGLSNVLELEMNTDPGNADTDGDGLNDGDEYQNGLDPRQALESDRSVDSDGDGMSNGYEADHSLDAFDAADQAMDKDGDGLSNYLEFLIGTHPDIKDSDNDGLEDGEEVLYTPYSVSEAPVFDWVDIEATSGTEVVFGDPYNGGEQLSIGFPFPYYGAVFGQLSVHVKGYMTFGDGESSQFQNGRTLPDPSAPKNMLAAFWGSLSMAYNANSTLYYQVQGMEPNRVLTVSWHDIAIQGYDSSASLNFQIQLQEYTGNIVYSYNDMLSANSDFEDGSEATIGLQNNDGTAGTLWSYNQIGAINSQMSLLFSHDPLAYTIITDPMNPDTDGDGMPDGFEVNRYDPFWYLDPNDPSDAVLDEDGDGLANLIEYQIGTLLDYWDTDFDGLSDYGEYQHGLNYLEAWPSDRDVDSDGDGMSNGYEVDHHLKPFDASDETDDYDEDGLTNIFEHDHALNPSNPDMDGDGLLDIEILYGLNPKFSDPMELLVDSDGDGLLNGYEADHLMDPFSSFGVPDDLDDDGLSNALESSIGTDPGAKDSDGDGFDDADEYHNGLSPTEALESDRTADSDGDGMPNGHEVDSRLLDPFDSTDGTKDWDADDLSNALEFQNDTDIDNADTDGDGFTDGFEVFHDFSPLNPLAPDRDGLADTEPDTMADLWEIYYLGDLTKASSEHLDNDFLTNGEEYLAGTNPLDEDTDGDGLRDHEDSTPLTSGPKITIVQPLDGARIETDTVFVEGTISFGGSMNTLYINAQTVSLVDMGSHWEFSTTVALLEDGVQNINATASGEKEGTVLQGASSHEISVSAHGPDLMILSASNGDTVSNLYTHFTVQVEGAATVHINGVDTTQDDYMRYAWVELLPGQNTVTVEATDEQGDVTTKTLTINSDVPSDHTEDPPVDADQDGVLDAFDFAPNDASVRSAISITSLQKGETIQTTSDYTSLETARTITLEGTAAARINSVGVHVKSLNGVWGSDRYYSANVGENDQYSLPVKLFPGTNTITVSSGTITEEQRVALLIEQPVFEVRGSFSGVNDEFSGEWILSNTYVSSIDKTYDPSQTWLPIKFYHENDDYRSGVYHLTIIARPGTYGYESFWGAPAGFSPSPVGYQVEVLLDGAVILSKSGTLCPVVMKSENLELPDINWWFYFGYYSVERVSFAIHIDELAGGYIVDAGFRDICPQGERLGHPASSFLMNYPQDRNWRDRANVNLLTHSQLELNGPNNLDPVYLLTGQSSQLSLRGILSDGGVDFENLVGGLTLIDEDEGEQAMVDVLGVFSALTLGHYQVGIKENYIMKPDGTYFTINDVPPIDIYVMDPRKLVPDYDRDGVIDEADRLRAETNEPFRFWVNDDDDLGDIALDGSDVPGQGGLFGSANYEDDEVNGRCDLLDFFPVWLDLHDTLSALPAGDGVEYKLRHDDEAVRFVYTDLTAGQANAFLTTEGNAYGSSFNQNAFGADTIKVTGSGMTLNSDFLNRIANDPAKGILMVEGIDVSTKPLVLEIWKDGIKVFENELNLSISNVEDMYRWINIRSVAGGSEDRATDTNEPSNFPDSLSNGKNFVFVHGYNVSEPSARAWNSEMFKRLYQTGSNARFHALTWRGNQSQFHIPILGSNVTPDYHVNVVNALNSALALKINIDNLEGQTVVAGHSLGNMIVGGAVARWDADVDKWFMIDGAVAIENFDGSASVQESNMMHPDWLEYYDRLWASEWHELFGLGDYRGLMSWRDYFTDALSKTYNFYSSGEDVLKTHVGDPGLWDIVFGGEAWCLQEKRKGRNWIISIGGSTYGGWGFNDAYDANLYKGTNHVLLADEQIRTDSFFRPGGSGLQDLYDPVNGSDFAGNYIYELLAGFVPARTLPCGANELGILIVGRNFNMNSMQNGWPQERLDVLEDGDRWFHSDVKKVAYPYVRRVFEEFVAQGGLE